MGDKRPINENDPLDEILADVFEEEKQENNSEIIKIDKNTE